MRLLADGPGEGLPALVWIVASELGHHRAAAAQTVVATSAAETSQTAPWTSDGCVGEKRIFRLPSGHRNVVVIVAPVLPPLLLPPGQNADSPIKDPLRTSPVCAFALVMRVSIRIASPVAVVSCSTAATVTVRTSPPLSPPQAARPIAATTKVAVSHRSTIVCQGDHERPFALGKLAGKIIEVGVGREFAHTRRMPIPQRDVRAGAAPVRRVLALAGMFFGVAGSRRTRPRASTSALSLGLLRRPLSRRRVSR